MAVTQYQEVCESFQLVPLSLLISTSKCTLSSAKYPPAEYHLTPLSQKRWDLLPVLWVVHYGGIPLPQKFPVIE